MLSLLTGCNSTGLLVVNLLAGLDNYHVYENLSYGVNQHPKVSTYQHRKVSRWVSKIIVFQLLFFVV